MAETILKSPGYADRELDGTVRTQEPTGVPYGVIGTSLKGPAFVPVSLGSNEDRERRIGNLDPKFVAPYLADKILDNKDNLLFLRLLGGGANTSVDEIETTRVAGVVTNAGVKLTTTTTAGNGDTRHVGAVQFLAAKHIVSSSEALGFPTMFTDNDSFSLTGNAAYLVRAVLLNSSDSRFMLLDSTETWDNLVDDAATLNDTVASPMYRKFKLVQSSSAGASFSTADGVSGLRIFSASLNPSSPDYIAKILNTDPERFGTEKHLLFLDFPVDAELASVASGSGNDNSIVLLSGSANTSTTSGISGQAFRNMYGRLDTRFRTAKTPSIISQPFSGREYDLFYVEPLDDGEVGNKTYKISISNLRTSTDPANPYGTFSLLVRDFNDSDFDIKVLEQFNGLNLDPNSDNFIGRVIGDKKVFFNFDATEAEERKLVQTGTYPVRSKYIRVQINADVQNKVVPAEALPFGFRGYSALNTNLLMTDSTPTAAQTRLAGSGTFNQNLTGSIVPPMPYRFKVTRGEVASTGNFTGEPGIKEITDGRLFWGIKPERTTNVANSNISPEKTQLVETYTKLMGIELLDAVYTGSFSDQFNNNKFTLAKVALNATALSFVTASANVHMRETAYIRNGVPNTLGIVSDAGTDRVTLATLVNYSKDSTYGTLFNKFSDYAKFTMVFQGGYDGVNFLDKDAKRFTDRAMSTESSSVGYGGAHSSFTSPGLGINAAGYGSSNNALVSVKTAAEIMTEPLITGDMNVLFTPGVREPLAVDYTANLVDKKHGMCFYVIDIPSYDKDGIRIFDGETNRFIDIEKTSDLFDARRIDQNSLATYLPSVVIEDLQNNRRVTVPASVAAGAAYSYNDKVTYPWWAPAGLNRASLDFVKNTSTKLKQRDRDKLYSARINPIVKFPDVGYAIFAQDTLQQAKTALSSINVKRMVLEVRRLVVQAATKVLWEGIGPDTREKFVTDVTSLLSTVLLKKGIQQFKIVCDGTNNTDVDENENKMNGKILIKPTKAVEFIQMDFVATASGVQFS